MDFGYPTRQAAATFLPLFAVLNALCFFAPDHGLAQGTDGESRRSLTIGKVIGKADPNELTILTRNGPMVVLGVGNGKPFRVVNQTPAIIELAYEHSVALGPNNPDTFIYKFYETERDLVAALILEEVDFAEIENEKSALEVHEANSNIQPQPMVITPNTVEIICYNHRHPILKSKRVRTALAYAINHGQIKSQILGGKADIATGPFDDRSPFFNSNMNSYKYDPKKAIALLEADGWTDTDKDGILDKAGVPFRIELLYQKGVSLDEAVSRQILINLLKLKVQVNPKPLPKSAINDQLHSGQFDAVLMDITFENNMESLAEFFTEGGSRNYMNYRSLAIQNYVTLFNQTADAGDQKFIIKSMQNVINGDQPVNFLYFKWVTHYLINVRKIENFRDSKGDLRPFEEWILKDVDLRE